MNSPRWFRSLVVWSFLVLELVVLDFRVTAQSTFASIVGAVEDHLFALAESLWWDVALPPGQHRLAVKLLHLQIARLCAGGQWAEPDYVSSFIEDQWS